MQKLTIMKRLFLFTALAVLISSCANLDKLVEDGRYEEAIHKTIRKMKGDKHKKTKHVLALEEAFNRIQDRDLRQAKGLETGANGNDWDRIYRLYKDISERQSLVRPFLPLVSKDGYRASFNFIKVEPLLTKAAENAADHHYTTALRYIERGSDGDKMAARSALASLDRVEQYFVDYKDVYDLKKQAEYLGKTRIMVVLENHAPVIIPSAFEEEVLSISVRDLNTRYKEFYLNHRDNLDVIAKLDILGMDVSPERESIRHFDEQKRVKDGWEYMLDTRGNILRDSLGNKVKVDKYIIARARVDEMHREKRAIVYGKVRYIDARTNELIDTRPIEVESIFEDYAVQFSGDRRALSDQCIDRLKPYPAPFPSNYQMTLTAAEIVKEKWKSDLERQFR